MSERVVRRDRPPVARKVKVEGTGLDGDAVADQVEGLAEPLAHDGAVVNLGKFSQGFQKVDMRVHRLEAVINSESIGPLGHRCIVLP